MIIFLNGSINAGKTTVAKILAKKIPNMALVEIDALRAMIDWMPIDEAIPLNIQNAVSVIKNFSKNKLDVVVPYPLSRKNYDNFMLELSELDVKKYVFTLAPKIQNILSNRGTRELDDWERDRIQYHYEIGINNPDFGEIIDNSEQTPEETAEIIIKKLRN